MQLMNVIYYPKRKHETQCFPRFSHPPEPALEAYFMTSNSLQLVSLDQFSNGSPLDDVWILVEPGWWPCREVVVWSFSCNHRVFFGYTMTHPCFQLVATPTVASLLTQHPFRGTKWPNIRKTYYLVRWSTKKIAAFLNDHMTQRMSMFNKDIKQ